jgi:hypothetical protein
VGGSSSFASDTGTNGIILLAFFWHLWIGGVDNLMLVPIETLQDGQ